MLLATGRVDFGSKDCFGRTPLWWARKCGNTDIAQLLLDYAEVRGIPVYESDVPTAVGLAPNDEASGWCDVCTLNILKDDFYYVCEICNDGLFYICLDCYKIGGRCLEVGHKLFQRKDDDESS